MVDQHNAMMPSDSEMHSLPTIDMRASEDQIVSQMHEIMTTSGFLCLKNIEGFDEQRLLNDIKEFHSMPQDVKRTLYTKQFDSENPNQLRGFFPFQKDDDESSKEFFDMGCPYHETEGCERTKYLVEETPMPEGQQYESIVTRYRAHEAFMRELGIKVAEYLALGMGKERTYFNEWFRTAPLSTFRSTRYFPRAVKNFEIEQEESSLMTQPHSDSGFITLMTCFGFPGLQTLFDDEYKFVRPEPNQIVVNLGSTFERITNYLLKAGTHQIADIGIERFNCSFFLDPKSSAIIPENIFDQIDEQHDLPMEYGKSLARDLRRKHLQWREAFPNLSDEEDAFPAQP